MPTPPTSIIRKELTIAGIAVQAPYGLAPINSGLLEGGDAKKDLRQKFYDSFCNDKLGILTIGGVAISPQGRANRHALVLDSTTKITDIAAIVESASHQGVQTAIQLEHAGRQTSYLETGHNPVAASSIPCPVVGSTPVELSTRDIRSIVHDFASAASLANKAGIKLIEIHAAHGYLLSGFLSRYSNTRIDSYGGSTRNRFRILEETLEEVSNRIGGRVGVRINVYENEPEGQVVEHVLEGLEPMTSKLAYISISAGQYRTSHDLIMPSRHLGAGLWKNQAKRVRDALHVPVFLAGNIETVATANQILLREQADVILFGRALLSDPAMLQKSSAGAKFKSCTHCGLCKYHTHGFDHVYCPVNDLLKRTLEPTRKR